MANRDTIVVGASAGGVQALSTLVAQLPSDLPAAVFLVLHIPAHVPSLIDALFRSAARSVGPRAIGVILTGARDDGKNGMTAIKQRGGIAIIQDPAEALYPSMPLSVMHEVKVDYSLRLGEIAPMLYKFSRETVEEEGGYPVPDEVEIEARITEQEMESSELIASVEKIGKISKLTCPDCHGALWEIRDNAMLRYRCHVGHAYSAESLSEGQSQMLEVALWSRDAGRTPVRKAGRGSRRTQLIAA